MILLTDDEPNWEADSYPSDEPVQESENSPSEHHLSLNAMKGSQGAGTIRFTGQIAGFTI